MTFEALGSILTCVSPLTAVHQRSLWQHTLINGNNSTLISHLAAQTYRSRQAFGLVARLCCGLLCVFAAAQSHAQGMGITHGLVLRVFDIDVTLSELAELAGKQTPNVHKIIPFIDFDEFPVIGQTVYQNDRGDLELQDVLVSFDVPSTFIALIDSQIEAPGHGIYEFRMTSSDGAQLFIDGLLVVDHNGEHASPGSATGSVTLSAGVHNLHIEYFKNVGTPILLLEWKRPADSHWERVPQSAFLTENDFILATEPSTKRVNLGGQQPGDGVPLVGVHPAFTLVNIRPEVSTPPAGMPMQNGRFNPQVGAMAFLPNGDLLVTDWGDSSVERQLWKLSGVVEADDASSVSVRSYAMGFSTLLAIAVVDADEDGNVDTDEDRPADGVYALDAIGLHRLRDLNGDGDALDAGEQVALTLSCPAGDIKLSGNSSGHQFNLGLVWADHSLWATLSSALGGGLSTRGHLIRIDPVALTMEVRHSGLRTPNGLGIGMDGELFGGDNQGNWLPANKLIHYPRTGPGKWFGFHNGHALGNGDAGPETPPTLWLPHGEVSLSPTQPIAFDENTHFAGQMLQGELTGGGVRRIFLEPINGVYQGAVFRFSQGLEVGTMAVRWRSRTVHGEPVPQLFTAGLGGPGHVWNWQNTRRGMQKLVYNGAQPFEMLAVRAMANGFEIEFTQPVDPLLATDPSSYELRQWHYLPTASYGGSKQNNEELTIQSIAISQDHRKVFLELPGIVQYDLGTVVYFRLRGLLSEVGSLPWSTEAWYTLHSQPVVAGPNFSPEMLPAPDLADGLLAHWAFEGTGSTIVDSVGNHDLTLEGGLRTTGKQGMALTLDGIDDAASSPSARLNLGDRFTIAAWVRRPISSSGDQVLLSRGGRGPGGVELLLDGNNELLFYSAELGLLQSHVVLANDSWEHVAVSYRAGTVKFYLNGVFRTAKSVTGSIPDETAILGIGANAKEATRYFNGSIDEFRIYGRNVSSREISLLASGSSVPYYPTSGLVAAYPFQEGVGSVTKDLSGGGTQGNLSNSTWRIGAVGQGLSFQGAGSVDLGPSNLNLAGHFTVSCFVRGSDFSGRHTLLRREAVEAFASYHFYLQDGGVRFAAAGLNVAAGVGGGSVPPDNQWHHVAVSYDGVRLRVFMDGALAWTSGTTWGFITSESAPTHLAAGVGASNALVGDIDEFLIYNRPLDSTEISQLANPATIQPVPVLTTESSVVTDAFNVAVNFSGPVTGLAASDFTIYNGALQHFSGSADAYSLSVTPFSTGDVIITLPPGIAQGIGGAPNISAFLKVTATSIPAMKVSLEAVEPVAPHNLAVRVMFNRHVTGLAAEDFIVYNGVVTQVSGSGNVYRIEIAPDSEGQVEVILRQSSVYDSQTAESNPQSGALILSTMPVAAASGPGGVGQIGGQSGLELWLRSDTIGGTDGSEVVSWPDLSGKARDVTTHQYPGHRPTLETQPADLLNGYPTVSFKQDQLDDLRITTNGGITAFAVLRPDGPGYYNFFEFDFATRPMLWIDPRGHYEYSFSTGAGGAVAPPSGGWDLLVMRQTDAGQPEFYVNSSTPTVIGTGSFVVPTSGTLTLFNRNGQASSRFRGSVVELIIYGDTLDPEDIEQIGGYLSHRYGLDVGFPEVPPPYLAWSETAFPVETPNEDRDIDVDVDHDGLSNLEEFFHALDPIKSDYGLNGRRVSVMETELGFYYALELRLRDPMPAGLTYRIRLSPDLLTWVESEGWLTSTLASGPGWKQVRLRSPESIGSENAQFFQLEIIDQDSSAN